MKAFLIILLPMFYGAACIFAQDLENLGDAKPVKANGGISYSHTLCDVHGMDYRSDPNSWVLNANLNFSLYGVLEVPFSAYFSKNNETYTSPSYNQFGASPKYKWITVHAGYRNMHFSDYSLSGLTFLGSGVEAEIPNSPFCIKAMYGRLSKAVPEIPGNNSDAMYNPPSYQRIGWGTMLTYQKDENMAGLIVFKAQDNIASIPAPVATPGLYPKENLVIGFQGARKITSKIAAKAEYTFSAMTDDTRMHEIKMDSYTYLNNLGELYRPRYSSACAGAVVIRADYSGDKFSGGVSYKRVNPGFQSLGTTYLGNDVEDYLFNCSRPFLKNKINLSGSLGFQRNNLDKSLESTNLRYISTVSLSYAINQAWSLTLNYSNFNSSTAPSTISIRDTFHFAQVNDNKSMGITHQFGKGEVKHSAMLSVALQQANTLNELANTVVQANTRVTSVNLCHNMYLKPLDITVTSGANYNRFVQDVGLTNECAGPMAALARPLFKKLIQSNLSWSYLMNYLNGISNSAVNTLQGGASYKYRKHHAFRLSLSSMFRDNQGEIPGTKKKSSEFRGTITYNFNF